MKKNKFISTLLVTALILISSCYRVDDKEETSSSIEKGIQDKGLEKLNNAVEVSVKGITIDSKTNSPVVLLEDSVNKRVLPIWIGIPEARAIAVVLEQIKDPRPMTHDLITNILETTGIKLVGALITKIENNIFYARLYLKSKGKTYTVDSRPSDAIAISLRTKSHIYVAEDVFEDAGSIPMEEKPFEDFLGKIGLEVQNITDALALFFNVKQGEGVLVSDVKENSPSSKAGIKRGDIITKVNNTAVSSVESFLEEATKIKKSKESLKLEILRNDKILKVELSLEGF